MRTCSRCHGREGPDRPFSSPRLCGRCALKKKGAHGSSQEWKDANRERLREYNRAWRTSAKSEVLRHYGTSCECCGEDDVRFLTIDHRDGNGRRHRAEIGRRTGPSFYRWLKAQGFPEGYAVLCFNCNCGRSVNGGVCPHRAQKLAL